MDKDSDHEKPNNPSTIEGIANDMFRRKEGGVVYDIRTRNRTVSEARDTDFVVYACLPAQNQEHQEDATGYPLVPAVWITKVHQGEVIAASCFMTDDNGAVVCRFNDFIKRGEWNSGREIKFRETPVDQLIVEKLADFVNGSHEE